MNRPEIIIEEKICINDKPRYIIIFYKHKSYSLIIERFGYRDFKFYYEGETLPEPNIKEEIEDFLYKEFLDYAEWNKLY